MATTRKNRTEALLQSTRAFIKNANGVCDDPRKLVYDVALLELKDDFPNAFRIHSSRVRSSVFKYSPQLMVALYDILEFVTTANIGHEVFNTLVSEQLLEKLPDADNPGFAAYLKGAIVPEVATDAKAVFARTADSILQDAAKGKSGKWYSPSRRGATRQSDYAVAQDGISGALSSLYLRFRKSATVGELSDVIYDTSRLVRHLLELRQSASSALRGVADISMRNERRLEEQRLHACRRSSTNGTRRGGSPTSTPSSTAAVYAHSPLDPGVTVTDAAFISSFARVVVAYYSIASDAHVLLNSRLRSEFRVRAGLRLAAQVALVTLNISCVFTVGLLFGTPGRLGCTSVNLIMGFTYLMLNSKARNDMRKIRSHQALKSIDPEHHWGHGVVLFALATLYTFRSRSRQDDACARGFDGRAIDLDGLACRLLRGTQTPHDACDLVHLRFHACKSGQTLHAINVKTGYMQLKSVLERNGMHRDVVSMCDDAIQVLDELIVQDFHPNSNTSDFVAAAHQHHHQQQQEDARSGDDDTSNSTRNRTGRRAQQQSRRAHQATLRAANSRASRERIKWYDGLPQSSTPNSFQN